MAVLIDWVLRPILTGLASKFLYPEVIHPALMRVWKSREWKETTKIARRVVRFYNRPENDQLPDEIKRELAFEMIKEQLSLQDIEMKDNKINAAIVAAIEAEKVGGAK